MDRNRPEKIRHHTVPKRYLKGFSVADDAVMQYDRESLNCVNVKLQDASVVRRMYSVKCRDGTWHYAYRTIRRATRSSGV